RRLCSRLAVARPARFTTTARHDWECRLAQYADGGRGATVRFTTFATPIGIVLAAVTDRGLCAVRIGDDGRELVRELEAELPAAVLVDPDDAPDLRRVVDVLALLAEGRAAEPLPLDVQGTVFQAEVWEAVKRIPLGQTWLIEQLKPQMGLAREVTDSRPMKLPLARFLCCNGHEFEAPSLPGTYGQFVLRSANGDLVSVDASDDPVFAEVDRLANSLDAVAALDDARRGRVVRAAFETTIDPSSDGRPFRFSQDPPCPECGTTTMESDEVVDPVRHIEVDVAAAGHEQWNRLDEGARLSHVRSAVMDALSV
ncbi:MAG: methylated-DNA--[protein]-cysteine S-methyltransferase, partial [Acidimicrobiales bacterium]